MAEWAQTRFFEPDGADGFGCAEGDFLILRQSISVSDQGCDRPCYDPAAPGEIQKGNGEHRVQALPGADSENLCHAQHLVTKLGYSTDVFDLEPVLIQPAYIQCAEPSDLEIVRALKGIDR